MTTLRANGFPEDEVRARARNGTACVFPAREDYGHALFGAEQGQSGDPLDSMRLVPPVFMPQRLEKLIDLGREPLHGDVELGTDIGGFRSAAPLFLSAFGSTQVASGGLGAEVSRQAGELGIPMVIGENVVPVNGYRKLDGDTARSLLGRMRAYSDHVPDGLGGVVVQQSTEDADAEVWNLVYSDPSARSLLETGRLGFELKVGQGAKPGLGGMTVLDRAAAGRVAGQYALDDVLDDGAGVLRSSTPGTFTEEIMRQQVRFMRNNFPRARIWVKLHPARDVAEAVDVAWDAGADAVTVDGAEGGTGWAPRSFLGHVGLPLAECLRRVGQRSSCLLATSRMWEGTRVAKCLALGARAAGLGRAAIIAADEDPDAGLTRLVRCLELELRLLVSALGKYAPAELGPQDVWSPEFADGARQRQLQS